MLYQSFEECGRLRSIIFRRVGRFMIDKIYEMRMLEVVEEVEKDKNKKTKKRRRKKNKKGDEETLLKQNTVYEIPDDDEIITEENIIIEMKEVKGPTPVDLVLPVEAIPVQPQLEPQVEPDVESQVQAPPPGTNEKSKKSKKKKSKKNEGCDSDEIEKLFGNYF
jgi:hypothetical protein